MKAKPFKFRAVAFKVLNRALTGTRYSVYYPKLPTSGVIPFANDLFYLYLYTLAISPSLGGSQQQKQWGPHSVPLAMTRDPAEFGWYCQ